MSSAIDQEKFKQGLLEDLANAQATAKQTSAGRGGDKEPSDFSPRSLRIKNKVIGREELDRLNSTIDTSIRDLVTEANFADDIQAKRYENDLRKKFNQYKLQMIRQAGHAAKERTKANLDEESSNKMWANIAGLVSKGTSIAVGAIGSGGASPATSNVAAAQQGEKFFSQDNPYAGGVPMPEQPGVDFDKGTYEWGSQFGKPRKIGLT